MCNVPHWPHINLLLSCCLLTFKIPEPVPAFPAVSTRWFASPSCCRFSVHTHRFHVFLISVGSYWFCMCSVASVQIYDHMYAGGLHACRWITCNTILALFTTFVFDSGRDFIPFFPGFWSSFTVVPKLVELVMFSPSDPLQINTSSQDGSTGWLRNCWCHLFLACQITGPLLWVYESLDGWAWGREVLVGINTHFLGVVSRSVVRVLELPWPVLLWLGILTVVLSTILSCPVQSALYWSSVASQCDS